jgi:hypothetical protein
MKRYDVVGCLITTVLMLAVGLPARASAQGCVALGGVINGAECQIGTALVKSGTFNLEVGLTLHLLNSGGGVVGSITTGGASISITVHGDMIMDSGTLISADKPKGVSVCNTAGSIDLIVDSNVTLKPGSIIRANSCTAGPIHITAGLSIDAQGLIESVGTNKATDQPGGGPITLETPCNLTVSGTVSSRGFDPGADLVRLVGGCFVKVFGLVESTGGDHKIPVNPPNHCNGVFRPGKPANSTTCIEIVAGDQLVIDAVAPHNGEVNANHGGINGKNGLAWIDLFARGTIEIKGDVNPPFAVHSDELTSGGGRGGDITVKSRDASVTASGLAISADNLRLDGGTVTIQAATDVKLDDAQIQARGDFTPVNGFGTGGAISAKAFNGVLSWQDTATPPASVGDVQPNGDGVPLVERGTIELSACTGAPNTTGTSFPVSPGAIVPPFPVTAVSCGGAPSFPGYIVFPDCVCQGVSCPCVTSFACVQGQPNTVQIQGTELTAVNNVYLSTGSCNVGDPGVQQVPINSKSSGSIVVDVGALAAGPYKIITTQINGLCCSASTISLPCP